MDLSAWAAEIGSHGPVTITGLGSRGGPVADARPVRPPSGIDWFEPAEMTLCCGAGTPVAELAAALADHDQTVAISPSGTVGGALAVGQSDVRRLGRGAIRDVLLQARYVSAAGEVVKAGGPTVKNVSGFDLCRLLVGSRGTLGFLGEVVLKTRPRPEVSRWVSGVADPFVVLREVYRPAAVLWDGTMSWVCLEGDEHDVAAQADRLGLAETEGPPALPPFRWSIPPGEVAALTGDFVAEVGVGMVHRNQPPPDRRADPAVVALHRRLKHEFDPAGRFNPGLDLLAPQAGNRPDSRKAT